MRIISGKYKGRRINPPKGLPVRPTTDQAKEGIFNVLTHQYGVEGATVLDLFCGTGNMAFEFSSRGAASVLCVDRERKCVEFVKKFAAELGSNEIQARAQDAIRFLKSAKGKFDIIFMDPPYDHADLDSLIDLVYQKELLAEEGVLVLEHSQMFDFTQREGIVDLRTYGDSAFSFFSPES